MLPKGHGGEKINIDDKVLLEYYKLEKDFEGPIELESTEGGYTPISGDSGHREPKKDPLTVIIDKIKNEWLPQTGYELLTPNYIMVNYPTNDENTNFGEIIVAIKDKKA